jgi:hypothetical protein
MDEASPEALHQLLRQEWRVFLYTPLDEDHLSYILRVTLKNSTPVIAERGLREVSIHISSTTSRHISSMTSRSSRQRHLVNDSIIERLDHYTNVRFETASSILQRGSAWYILGVGGFR